MVSEDVRGKNLKPVVAATLIAISAGFVLGGYEFIRSPSNTLFKGAYGSANLPTIMALIPLSVLLVTYIFGRILSAFGSRKTLLITTVGSALIMSVGVFLYESGFKPAVWVVYLFRSAYVVLLIEQYWSFLNSTLSSEDARKYNGPICGIGSLGAIAAGLLGSEIASTIGTASMIYIAAALTLPAAFFSDLAYKKFGEPKDEPDHCNVKEPDHLGLKLFKKEKVLVLIFLIILATQVVAAVLEISFQTLLQVDMPDPEIQTAWSMKYYALINGLSAVLQFIAAPLILRYVNPGFINILIPLLHVVTIGVFIGDPGLMTAGIAYAGFKCVDYSIFRAAKEMLYMPLSFDARYRAKEVIDTFGYRFSKGITSGAITIVQKNAAIVFTDTMFGIIALASCLVWAGVAAPLAKYFKMRVSKKS
jgi:AAA family ATP:ADP antiporter